MSIFVTSHAWAHSKSSGSTLLVLLAICDFSDDTGRAYPSVNTLGEKARSSERTVQYALRELIALQELVIDRGAGPHGCNLYRVQVQNLRGAIFAGVQGDSFGGAASCTRTTIEPSKKKESVRVTFDPATGKFEGIPESLMTQWRAAHASIDIDTELVRSSCWLIANPAQAKKNYLRFLNGWLSRAKPGGTASFAADRPMSRAERAADFGQRLTGSLDLQQPQGQSNAIDVDAREVRH